MKTHSKCFDVRQLYCLMFLGCLMTKVCPLSAQPATLLGVDRDSGNLYQISTVDASLTFIGNTGIQLLGNLEFAPNGLLYAFTIGSDATLYRIDPNTAQSTAVGRLGVREVFEGGLAFAPDGTGYGVNGENANTPQLFRINSSTGQATIIGTISGGAHDINGLA